MADRAPTTRRAQHSQPPSAPPSTLASQAAWEDTRLETRPMPPTPLIDPRRRFDVCHVGLVLRAVLGVQLVQGLGLAMAQQSLINWAWSMGTSTVASMTALLSWLLIVCGLKRVLARLPQGAQWALPIALGAACAHLGTGLLVLMGVDVLTPLQRVGAAGFGALGAAMLLFWLMLRERAQAPAEALARLVELQSRIRPHFLFNTLNTAIALVRVDPSRAEEVLEDLAELFRVALADTGPRTEGVPLSQEVDLAKRYLAIEQLRFGERLRVEWQVDPHGNDTRVPPLLLQPLVENAVRHGVEPNDRGGDVSILTRVRGNEVEIRVVNTVGAPARTRGHGLALKNVKQRLRLMHDVAARIEVAPSPTRFMVRILLPR